MSFATRIAQASKPMPVYILEFDGLLADGMGALFASASGWGLLGTGSSLSVETVNALGYDGGIKFNKGASTSGGASKAGLPAVDYTDSALAYEGAWVYLPSVSDVTTLNVRRGTDATNYYQWTIAVANLVEGWNYIPLSRNTVRSGDTFDGETGSVTDTAVTYYLVLVSSGTSADLQGIVLLPPLQHPTRFSTSKVTSPVVDVKPWATTPSIAGGMHDPTSATLSSSSATMRVVDIGSATVIAALNSYLTPGRGVSILMGFAGDAETADNFSTIFRGSLVSMMASGRSWELSMQDILSQLRVPFARDATSGSPLVITGNAVDVALKIITSTGNGTNGDYDVLTAAEGAAIPATLVDVSGIETMRDEWRTWAYGEWSFPRSQPSALEFLFQEVCLSYSVVPYITAEGLLSLRASEEGVYPATSTSVTLGAANIITTSPEYKPDLERIRNQVRIRYNRNESTGEYDADTGDAYRLQESIDRYGLRELTIDSKGIRSASVAEKVAKSHYYRIGDGSPPVSMEVFASQQPRTVGELVEITTALVPDIASGTYTSTGIVAELEQASFNPEAGRVAIRAGVTSYRRGAYRRIAPSGTADYDSQTDTEKARYCSIADGSDELGAASDPAHRIGP